VLFGATVLGEPHLHSRFGRAALRSLNRKGIFDNVADTEQGSRTALSDTFRALTVEVVGAVAVFTAAGPRPAGTTP
jgi:hypothetical protein